MHRLLCALAFHVWLRLPLWVDHTGAGRWLLPLAGEHAHRNDHDVFADNDDPPF